MKSQTKIAVWALFTIIPAAVISYRIYSYLDVYFEPHNSGYLGPAFIMVGLPGALVVLFLIGLFIYQARKVLKK
jgi:hypothetical protein